MGYVAAPAALTAELRRLHQFNVFCVNTPMQHGIAAYMQNPAPWQQLPAFYAAKRDRFRAGLAQTRFRLLPCEGAYFQCADISELHVPERNLPEATFCEWLTREIGVAAIPLFGLLRRWPGPKTHPMLDLRTGRDTLVCQDKPDFRYTWGDISWQPQGKGLMLLALKDADRTYANIILRCSEVG